MKQSLSILLKFLAKLQKVYRVYPDVRIVFQFSNRVLKFDVYLYSCIEYICLEIYQSTLELFDMQYSKFY